LLARSLEIEISDGIWRRQNSHAADDLVRHLAVLRSIASEGVRRIDAFNGLSAVDVCGGHGVQIVNAIALPGVPLPNPTPA
jgi:hypothetical protein